MNSSHLSTSPPPTSPVPPGESRVSPQKQSLKDTLMGWLQLKSFGGRLYWMIMIGALSGVGGMAFLFGEMIKYQAEDQVRSTLNGKVNAIASVTEAAETLVYGLGVSATTLHERQAQYADTYRELTLQFFEKRPEFVVGLGLGQRENGLIVDQSWLFPYYWVESSKVAPSTSQAPILYEDFADDVGEFYPDSERYKTYFVSQSNRWTEPYEKGNNQLLTYYFPLFASDGRWLGTTLVDIDGQYLSELLNDPVFRGMGNFRLLTRSGTIVADPANPENNLKTYQDIADLKDLWPDVDREGTGFLEGETGYWAYATVPGQDWLVFGFVPYGAVFGRIAQITLAATALMVTLLSVAIFLAVRRLNRRLRPVLNQCNQIAQTDSTLLAQWVQQDELNQLSLAFFNMLEQLNLNEETIRRHEQKIEKETTHVGQLSDQFTEFTELLAQQASQQKSLVHRVQRLVAEIANGSQSVDIQLDALNTMGRALTGDLRRVPTHSEETLWAMEQQIQVLINALGTAPQPTGQLRELASQLAKNMAVLKAHHQRRPSVDSLQQQTGSITQAGQAAAAESRSMVEAIQSTAQILTKIEQISAILVQRAKSVVPES
ncbi:MAG: methyl-accepting chemotaxis protein [Cyanobacteria bacterium P01_D01_bin.2]